VGGEDEILFDGKSFVTAGDEIILELKSFEAESKSFTLEDVNGTYSGKVTNPQENTWENLFAPRLNYKTTPVTLVQWSDEECAEVLKALTFGFQEYAKKSGF